MKKRHAYCVFAFCLAAMTANAQNWEWAKKGGGTSNDVANAVATDGDGNVYTTGSFNGSATFGTTVLTSAGSTDIYIAKQDKDGTFLWAVRAGGTGAEEGKGIAVDASGNVMLTGYFGGTATFGTTALTSAGGSDVFLACYTGSGAFSWVTQMGGTSNDVGNAIAVTGGGNHADIRVTGYFNATATFGTSVFTSAGGSDLFVAAYASGGSFSWAKQFGGTATDEGNAITMDASLNAYITGDFMNTITFGTSSFTSGGSTDVFTVKLNSSGSVTWAAQGSGSSFDKGQSLDLDDNGNVYVSGQVTSSILTFGSTSLSGGNGVFLVKYNSSGTVQWARSVISSSLSCTGTGLVIDDASQYIYLSGEFSGLAHFATTTINAGSTDVYLSRYSSLGSESLVVTGGGAGSDRAYGMAVNNLDHIYVAGSFTSSPATFNSSSISTSGGLDAFMVSFDAKLWPVSDGGSHDDQSYDIAVDAQGNSYVTGEFKTSTTFGTTTLTTAGDYAVFIAKYNASGVLQWVRKGESPTGTAWGTSIAVDASGNCYTTGYYHDNTTFNGITLTGCTGCTQSFLVKYDTDGNIQWAITSAVNSASNVFTNSVACDASSNVYVTGFFLTAVTIGTTTLTSTNQDAFIAKFNSSGAFQWAVGSTGGACHGDGIVTDGTNVYVTGSFGGTTTFGTFSVSTAAGDMFIAKYSSAGVASGVTATSTSTGIGCAGKDISMDNSGMLYLTGTFHGTTLFGTTSLTSSGYADIFVCKYNSSFVKQWAKRGGGALGDEEAGAISWGPGGVFVTGTTVNSGSFGSFSYTGLGWGDVFVTKYSTSGTEQFFIQMGGDSSEYGKGIGADQNGNVYVTGYFKGTGVFGSATLTPMGFNDIYIEKFSGTDGTAARIANEDGSPGISESNGLNIYPNPNNGTFTLSTDSPDAKDVFIYDMTGQLVFAKYQVSENEIPVDVSAQPKGIYLVRVVSGNEVQSQRIIRQ